MVYYGCFVEENMSESRAKNAIRNVIFAMFLKLYQIIVPFGVRTIFIYVLGMQYCKQLTGAARKAHIS